MKKLLIFSLKTSFLNFIMKLGKENEVIEDPVDLLAFLEKRLDLSS